MWVVNKVVATLPGGDHMHAHEVRDSRRWQLELLLMHGMMKTVGMARGVVCAVE
jgi:hypothetical protein